MTAIDFDVKISAERVVVIEMSPRLGGNGIPELIRRGTGVDLMDLTLRYALGDFGCLPDMQVNKPCGSWVFGSELAGELTHIATFDAMHAQVPALFAYVVNYKMGASVPSFEHSGNALGYALFDCSAEMSYAETIEQLQAAMQLQVTGNF